MLAEFNTDGVDNNILLWFRGNKVTLGYPNMQDIVSKAINDTSADERVQMQKIINKMFEPVFFQKYNKTNNKISGRLSPLWQLSWAGTPSRLLAQLKIISL